MDPGSITSFSHLAMTSVSQARKLKLRTTYVPNHVAGPEKTRMAGRCVRTCSVSSSFGDRQIKTTARGLFTHENGYDKKKKKMDKTCTGKAIEKLQTSRTAGANVKLLKNIRQFLKMVYASSYRTAQQLHSQGQGESQHASTQSAAHECLRQPHS